MIETPNKGVYTNLDLMILIKQNTISLLKFLKQKQRVKHLVDIFKLLVMLTILCMCYPQQVAEFLLLHLLLLLVHKPE